MCQRDFSVQELVLVRTPLEPVGSVSLRADPQGPHVVLKDDWCVNYILAQQVDIVHGLVILPKGDDEVLSDRLRLLANDAICAESLGLLDGDPLEGAVADALQFVFRVGELFIALWAACFASLVLVLVLALASVVRDYLVDVGNLVAEQGLQAEAHGPLLGRSFTAFPILTKCIAQIKRLQSNHLLHRYELLSDQWIVHHLEVCGLFKGHFVVRVSIAMPVEQHLYLAPALGTRRLWLLHLHFDIGIQKNS